MTFPLTGQFDRDRSTTSSHHHRPTELDVINILFFESVYKFSHLLDAAMSYLLEILAQTVLYLVFKTRLFATRHNTTTLNNLSAKLNVTMQYKDVLLLAGFSTHTVVFTVRRSLHGLSYRNSVRPSVCHTRGLCPHGSTYDHDFFTVW